MAIPAIKWTKETTKDKIELTGIYGAHTIKVAIKVPDTHSGVIKVSSVTHQGLPKNKSEETNAHFLARLAVHAGITDAMADIIKQRTTEIAKATMANQKALEKEMRTLTSELHTPVPIPISIISVEGSATQYFKDTGIRHTQPCDHYVKEVRTRITRS